MQKQESACRICTVNIVHLGCYQSCFSNISSFVPFARSVVSTIALHVAKVGQYNGVLDSLVKATKHNTNGVERAHVVGYKTGLTSVPANGAFSTAPRAYQSCIAKVILVCLGVVAHDHT